MKKRTIAVLLAVVMLMGVTIGATIAWLTSKTDPVENTFTVGDVEINLIETDSADEDTDPLNNSYQLVPGTTYSKDPVVSIDRSETNVDCYLFVKFEEVNSPSDYLTYTSTLTVANGWTQGNGTDIPNNVWYRTVTKDSKTISWQLLDAIGDYEDGAVTIKETVTKANMAEAANAKLKWTAYATQKDNLSVTEAWALFNP